MKKNLVLFLGTCMVQFIMSQQLVDTALIKITSGSEIPYAFCLSGDNSLKFAINKQCKASSPNKDKRVEIGNVSIGSMYSGDVRYINTIQTLSFGNKLSQRSGTSVLFDLKGGEAGYMPRNSSPVALHPISQDEFIQTSKGILLSAVPVEKTEIEKVNNGFIITTEAFDFYSNSMEIRSQESNMFIFSDKEINSRENLVFTNYSIDNANSVGAVCIGKKDKEIKFNEFKVLQFKTYKLSGGTVGLSDTIKFAYPRELIFAGPVMSDKEEGKNIGHVFVFATKSVREKYADPEENNFECVYLTTDGKIISSQSFKFGDLKKSIFKIRAAYGNNEKVGLFGYYQNSETLGYALVTISKTGPVVAALSSHLTFKDKVRTVKAETRITFSGKNIQITPGRQKTGFDFSLSETFSVQGIKENAQGEVFVWGQIVYENHTFENVTMPNGQVMSRPVTLITYGDLVGLHYSSSKELISVFAYKNDLPSVPVHFTTVFPDDASACFIISLPKADAQADDLAFYNYFSTIQNKVVNPETKLVYTPALVLMKYKEMTISSYITSNKDFYLIKPTPAFLFNKPDRSLYIQGFSKSQDGYYYSIEKIKL